MKIYDCFPFFNENNLLELRLEILNDYVDYFVIVESNQTHAGVSKEFNLDFSRVSKYKDKIIYIKVKNFPKLNFIDRLFIFLDKKTKGKSGIITGNLKIGKWKLENFQRDQIKRGLKNAKEEDIIIISDLDEIPNPSKFEELKEKVIKYNKIEFKQRLFYYFLNGYVGENWFGSRACSFQNLKKIFLGSPQNVRSRKMKHLKKMLKIKEKGVFKIEEGGWHFSHIGDGNIDKLIDKIISGPEGFRCKTNLNDREKILEKIRKGEDLFNREGFKIRYLSPNDKRLPSQVKKNKFKKIIFKNGS